MVRMNKMRCGMAVGLGLLAITAPAQAVPGGALTATVAGLMANLPTHEGDKSDRDKDDRHDSKNDHEGDGHKHDDKTNKGDKEEDRQDGKKVGDDGKKDGHKDDEKTCDDKWDEHCPAGVKIGDEECDKPTGGSPGNTPGIDQSSAVPEPMTALLGTMALGAVALSATRRRG